MANAILNVPKPALLMRRISRVFDGHVVTLSRDANAPMLRLPVEQTRGRLVVSLAAGEADPAAIQWTQNGVPIRGQTGPTLHLAGMTMDDGDVYYALIGSAAQQTRSQAFLVVVVAGNPLLNLSARGQVSPGQPLIAGFVIGRVPGPVEPKRYLVRAVGPSLRRFGSTETITHPTVALHRGQAKVHDLVKREEDAVFVREWQPKLGAFALDPDTAELVAVVQLEPGPYTLVVSGGESESGQVLIEIYEIPA